MTIKQGELFPIMKQPTDEYIVVSALASELPNALPQKILFTGVGKVNATHILTTFIQGDMDCGPLTEGSGITFGDDVAISDVLNFGTDGLICRTQDQFIDEIESLDMLQHLLEGNKFNVVDMEAYALAKVCAYMNVDFICYKYVSDDANDEATTDWEDNVSKGEPLFYDILEKEHLFERLQ